MIKTTIKTKLSWLWEKVKKYWYLLVFAVVATYALVFAKNKESVIENMMRERDAMLASHNTRIQEIQAGIEAERKRREEIEKSYNDLVSTIQSNKENRAKEILAANESEIKRLIERNRNNPEEMAMAINRLFGITIIEQPIVQPPPIPAATIPENPY